MRIEGRDLPGGEELRLRNVHVGVQRKAEVIELVPVTAATAAWEFDVTAREVDELLDVGGPFVHGRPGARFLYLAWGNVAGDGFDMFRRAKLMFGDVPTAVLRDAYENGGLLVGELGLTDEHGDPRCARVRDVVWTRRP
ncbi:DUF5990 family protein [Actinoplanes subtropicus]|uniref:DUF5990 family protein n=1 Tax=Actinoplanes subtropicus TaxID=543632 RepID=UPI00068A1402|nr:DUF5990 family protein [Actinoplanes subtropicus]